MKKSTAFLTILGIFLLFVSCGTTSKALTPSEMKDLKPSGQIVNGVRVVKVTAERYAFTPDPIVVRAGENVRLELTSRDTTHGFALPAYNIDVQIDPGDTSTATFVARETGSFPVHCSVFCGLGHPGMQAALVVLPAQG